MLAITGPHQYAAVVAAVHDGVPHRHDPDVGLRGLERRDVGRQELCHRRCVAVNAQHALRPARVVAHLGSHQVHAGDHLGGRLRRFRRGDGVLGRGGRDHRADVDAGNAPL